MSGTETDPLPEPDHAAPRRLELIARGVLGWAHQTYELQNSSARLRPMEGLRGLAVLMVFFVHTDALLGEYARHSQFLLRPSRFLGIVGNGGVDLFFVLSGYLIYGALIRHKASLLGFLGRRVERIYPTFLAVFALYLVLSVLVPSASKLHGRTWAGTGGYILQNLLLLPGIFQIVPTITLAWSLSYEFFFYIGSALLIAGTRMWNWETRTRAWFFAAIWCLYLAYCFTIPRSHVRALMFVVGILLYEALASKRFLRLLTRRGEMAAIVLFMGAIVISYLVGSHRGLLSFLPALSAGKDTASGIPGYQGPYKTVALSIGMFCCAAYCFAFDGRLKRFFSWTPLRYLGNISYSYYLIHGVTLQGLAMAWAWLASHGVPAVSFVCGGNSGWIRRDLGYVHLVIRHG